MPSFANLLSHQTQKSYFDSKYYSKMNSNHNNIKPNPRPDLCGLQIKFLSNG